MRFVLICLIFNLFIYKLHAVEENSNENEQCSVEHKSDCSDIEPSEADKSKIYEEASNKIYKEIKTAVKYYKSCNDTECNCYTDVIKHDLTPYQKNGITRQMIKDSSKYGTRYKILQHKLYRESDCMFPTRCSGIEHFLFKLLNDLPDMDLIINTRDWPQLSKMFKTKGAVFSFSKTDVYLDIMYPAWSFWAGGPAISLHPTGIGRWDLLRDSIMQAAKNTPWSKKFSKGFFRGSRTSDERDALVLLSRRKPDLLDAQFTKNQAWKSPTDTLNAEPAKEVSFEDHCKYKYLFNFRGVAASFRYKHLFLCKSLVFHVGDEWNEFYYFALKPWVHYVPIKSYASEQEIETILNFFQNNDNLAREIAERGYKFVQENLKMQDVECYWKKLLLDYAKLLRYKVQNENDIFEIKVK